MAGGYHPLTAMSLALLGLPAEPQLLDVGGVTRKGKTQAEAVQVIPGVEAGVVAVVEDDPDGVVADGFDVADGDEFLAGLQDGLAVPVLVLHGSGGAGTNMLSA